MKKYHKIIMLLIVAGGIYAMYHYHPWDSYNFHYNGKDYLCEEIAFDDQDNLLYAIIPGFNNGDTVLPKIINKSGDSARYWWMPRKATFDSSGKNIYAPNGRLLRESDPVSSITFTYYNYHDKRISNYIEYTDIHVVSFTAGETRNAYFSTEPYVGEYEDEGWFRIFKSKAQNNTIIKLCYLNNDRQPKYTDERKNRRYNPDTDKYENTASGSSWAITTLYLYGASAKLH